MFIKKCDLSLFSDEELEREIENRKEFSSVRVVLESRFNNLIITFDIQNVGEYTKSELRDIFSHRLILKEIIFT